MIRHDSDQLTPPDSNINMHQHAINIMTSHLLLITITMITIIALISLITIISIITTIIRYLVSLQVWTELLARLLLINIIATINLVNFPNHVPQQNRFDHPTDIQIHVS